MKIAVTHEYPTSSNALLAALHIVIPRANRRGCNEMSTKLPHAKNNDQITIYFHSIRNMPITYFARYRSLVPLP